MSLDTRADGPISTADPTAETRHDGLSGHEYRFSRNLISIQTPARGRAAIAIQQIAAQIIAHQLERGRRGLAVCGPNRGAGVTLMSANLAASLANAGASVLLVDANLHEPGINDLITPLAPSPGLRDLLAGDARLAEVIHWDIIPGLSVLYSGGATPEGSELLATQACESILRECLRDFDYTIVDTPPANRSADARRIGSIIGYGLIVARRNMTYVDDVSTLSGELIEDGVEIIGTMLNDA